MTFHTRQTHFCSVCFSGYDAPIVCLVTQFHNRLISCTCALGTVPYRLQSVLFNSTLMEEGHCTNPTFACAPEPPVGIRSVLSEADMRRFQDTDQRERRSLFYSTEPCRLKVLVCVLLLYRNFQKRIIWFDCYSCLDDEIVFATSVSINLGI